MTEEAYSALLKNSELIISKFRKKLAVFADNLKVKQVKVMTTPGNVFTRVIDCFLTGADNKPDEASIFSCLSTVSTTILYR